MKIFPTTCILALLPTLSAYAAAQGQPAAAASVQTYVCIQDGQTVYSTAKLNARCRLSQPRTAPGGGTGQAQTASAASASASAPSVPQIINEEIAAVWGDTVFTDNGGTETVAEPAPKNGGDGGKVNVNLRRSPPKISAPRIALPPKPAPLTRRQVLQKEIDRERAALKTAQSRLAAAQGRKDTAAVHKYAAQIEDRRQNLAALEAEMRR